MHEEIAALYQNQTWTIVPRPSDKIVIGCKWLSYTRESQSLMGLLIATRLAW